MHCPQCGQQQASSEMRFCSRCGFPLGGVTELLAHGGVVRSGSEEAQGEEHALSPRYIGVRQGVVMMLLGVVIVPILAIINSFMRDTNLLDLLVPISAIVFFAGGLMRILYALFYEKGTASGKPAAPGYAQPVNSAQLNVGGRVSALPPSQSTPVPNFTPRRLNTAELVRPPSVTENTTRLLDEEKSKRSE
jgi:hypothetical protein